MVMRRACSQFEAWGAWQRSRFADLASNCLEDNQANALGKKTAASTAALFGKTLGEDYHRHGKNILLSSHLLRRAKRQRLQELLPARKSPLARPSPQPLV